MSIKYQINQEKGYCVVSWQGVVTAEDFLNHAQRLLSDANWPTVKRLQLTDLRACNLDASMNDDALQKAATIFGNHPEGIVGLKLAVVASETFWKALEFERLISPHGATVIVFNMLPDACEWLNLDIAEISHALRQLHAEVHS